jgi:2-polyprenyl-6-methoxyphenol hydroxylase-like FAD-dependent oxidoreductase
VAYIVENDVIQACLLERLKQLGIEPRLNSKVKQIQYDDTALHVQLQDETSNLRTKLLVETENPSKNYFS